MTKKFSLSSLSPSLSLSLSFSLYFSLSVSPESHGLSIIRGRKKEEESSRKWDFASLSSTILWHIIGPVYLYTLYRRYMREKIQKERKLSSLNIFCPVRPPKIQERNVYPRAGEISLSFLRLRNYFLPFLLPRALSEER